MKYALMLVFLLVSLGGTLQATDNPRQITSEANGDTIDLKVGDCFDIVLAGNPTTGYTWEVAEGLDGVIEQKGKYDYQSQATQFTLGGGGTYTFHFIATGEGTARLKLIYHRTFEKDTPPIETFELTVNVSPP